MRFVVALPSGHEGVRNGKKVEMHACMVGRVGSENANIIVQVVVVVWITSEPRYGFALVLLLKIKRKFSRRCHDEAAKSDFTTRIVLYKLGCTPVRGWNLMK